MDFKIIIRSIFTEFGEETIIEKKYPLFKDQWKNRTWVVSPNDPILKEIERRYNVIHSPILN